MFLATAVASILMINAAVAAPGSEKMLFENDILGIDVSDFRDQGRLESMLSDAANSVSSRWPGGIVPFIFSDPFTYTQQSDIRKAMADIHRFTCVKFIPHTTEKDYIRITKSFWCSSYIGRVSGEQPVFLNMDKCEEKGAIQHELMHALGLYHEQARADRDKYVEINWDNMEELQQNNFKYYNRRTFSLPYDFESVMHYKSKEFAVNDERWTIRPREMYRQYEIGQRKQISSLDIARINLLYKCPDRDDAQLNKPSTDEASRIGTQTSTSVPSFGAYGIGENLTRSSEDATGDGEAQASSTTQTAILPAEPAAMFGLFEMKYISPARCSGTNTPNCNHGEQSQACFGGLMAQCSAEADEQEVQRFLENIQDLNASRALSFTIYGDRTFSDTTYAPVADILINLRIMDHDGFHISMIRSLRLPMLTSLVLENCNDVWIRRNDFWFVARLRRLMMSNSTVGYVEQGSFDSLPLLRQIIFDNDIPVSTIMSSAQKEHLRLLHCDCEYKWLRVYLEKNPQLIAEKKYGEVFDLGGHQSKNITIREVYAPVDCKKNDLIGEMSQILFSVNDACS